jgi:AcrR family transcriptional regulator
MRRYRDPAVRGDDIVYAVHLLIARDGIRAVTYRAVAALVGLSVSTLHDNFPTKVHLLNVAAYHLSLRRRLFFGGAEGVARLHRMVPESDIELQQSVIWLALRDHGRVEPMLSETLHEAEQVELALIRQALRGAGLDDPGRDVVQAVAALVEGLASMRTVGDTPLSSSRARAALETVLRSWGIQPIGDDDQQAA